MTTALATAAVYLIVHLVLYFAVLRNTRAFTREIVIFAYHAASMAFVACVVVVALLAFRLDIPTATAILAAHAIYSMSFLELWSLAEGGYSLAILNYVSKVRIEGRAPDLSQLEHVGGTKRTHRIRVLVALRLVYERENGFGLTPFGKSVASVLRAVTWAANVRTTGLG